MAYCTKEAWVNAKEEVEFVKKHNRQWGTCEIWEQQEARQVCRLYAVMSTSPLKLSTNKAINQVHISFVEAEISRCCGRHKNRSVPAFPSKVDMGSLSKAAKKWTNWAIYKCASDHGQIGIVWQVGSAHRKQRHDHCKNSYPLHKWMDGTFNTGTSRSLFSGQRAGDGIKVRATHLERERVCVAQCRALHHTAR